MTLDKSNPALHLQRLSEALHIAQYPVDWTIPPEAFAPSNSFLSITRTSDELSVVAPVDDHGSIRGLPHPDQIGGPYVALKIQGPLAFDMVGVMADLTAPLKTAGISIFVISTWNTDYLLVHEGSIAEATRALRQDGWHIS